VVPEHAVEPAVVVREQERLAVVAGAADHESVLRHRADGDAAGPREHDPAEPARERRRQRVEQRLREHEVEIGVDVGPRVQRLQLLRPSDLGEHASDLVGVADRRAELREEPDHVVVGRQRDVGVPEERHVDLGLLPQRRQRRRGCRDGVGVALVRPGLFERQHARERGLVPAVDRPHQPAVEQLLGRAVDRRTGCGDAIKQITLVQGAVPQVVE
jgi:hypothetical protein